MIEEEANALILGGFGLILRYRRVSHCRVLEEAVYRCYKLTQGVMWSMMGCLVIST